MLVFQCDWYLSIMWINDVKMQRQMVKCGNNFNQIDGVSCQNDK